MAEVTTVRVEFPGPLTDAGEKETVTPEGSPFAVRFTEPENPFSAPTVMVDVAELPGDTTTAAGDAASVKSGAVMVRLTVAVWDRLPLAPVTEIAYVPAVADAETVNVKLEAPEPVTEAGEKDAVTPAGMPLAVRLTAPPNPLSALTAIVEFAEPPGAAFTDTGAADSA